MTKRKSIFLLITMLAAIAAGAWFAFSPTLEKRDALARQEELLRNIAASSEKDALKSAESTNTSCAVMSTQTSFVETIPHDETAPQILMPVPTAVPTSMSTHVPTDSSIDINFHQNLEIGILKIECIELELPVVDGVSEEQLKVAVGRVTQTAQIGELGNAVIAGHRSYAHGRFFNRLGELAVGDCIDFIPISGEPMRFKIHEILTIEPEDQIAFVQPQDYAEITLYTCTPVRIATHRLLIRAKRVI